MSDKKKAPPRRMRWSVPAADVSTNRWLDAQDDVSASLKELIRESIRRDGYVDAANAPVEQLPRRGRPPLERQADDDGSAEETEKEPLFPTRYMRDDLGGLAPGDADPDTARMIHEIAEQGREAGADSMTEPESAPELGRIIENFTPHEVRSPEPAPASAPSSSVPQGLEAFLTS